MKNNLILVFCLFSFFLAGQPLEDDEARFFAQTLFDRDVLSEAGLAQLNLEIRNQQLGKQSNTLTGNPPLQLPPPQLSSIIGFLSNAYWQEFAFRTAKKEVGELAHTFFGDLPPKSMNTEQENALLAEARKRFAYMEGPKIEAALGQDVFADDILPGYFMIFARPAPTFNMMEKKRDTPPYIPLISPNRSVFQNGSFYVIDLLEEMGISRPGDRSKIMVDSIKGFKLSVHHTLRTVGKSVADREMAPERTVKNTAFIKQCVTFGLLDEATANGFLADKELLGQVKQFPFFNAFKRNISRITLGFRSDYETGIPTFMTAFRELDPTFKDADLQYELTPNARAPDSRHEDGDDLRLTFSINGNTWSDSYREQRVDEVGAEPVFQPSRKFINFINSCLGAAGHDEILFTILDQSSWENPGNLEGRGKYTLMLLTDEEAKALIHWSFDDQIAGPERYLMPDSGY